jgi:hypothetical protein
LRSQSDFRPRDSVKTRRWASAASLLSRDPHKWDLEGSPVEIRDKWALPPYPSPSSQDTPLKHTTSRVRTYQYHIPTFTHSVFRIPYPSIPYPSIPYPHIPYIPVFRTPRFFRQLHHWK